MPRSPAYRRPGPARRALVAGFSVLASLLAAVLIVVLGGLTALRLEYTGTPADSARSRGNDALWLGHAWVDGRKSDADIAGLVTRLRGSGVRDLYVHIGPLEHDGTLSAARYPTAETLIRSLHRALPRVRVQAWLGDVVGKSSPTKPTKLDLSSPATRERLTASALQAVTETPFDGVHFDLEPIADGNRDYPDVLARTRAALNARGAVLSVAAHQIEPADKLVEFARLGGAERTKWWTPAYFTEIASRVDQVAVMAYDTWMPTRGLFGGYVTRQTELALANTPSTTDLLIGLPFFHDDTIGHHES
ncbi:MAG: hypothetical protein HOV68_19500, partial [Streptomycetaceae bacterium]|nr:hypothetical protein [Streptomycetaceae bacterium]